MKATLAERVKGPPTELPKVILIWLRFEDHYITLLCLARSYLKLQEDTQEAKGGARPGTQASG